MNLALAYILGGAMFPHVPEKPERKCRLKDCTRMTTHNGGYCCAKHCTLDRKKRKQSK